MATSYGPPRGRRTAAGLGDGLQQAGGLQAGDALGLGVCPEPQSCKHRGRTENLCALPSAPVVCLEILLVHQL